jgi:hypothetical protein
VERVFGMSLRNEGDILDKIYKVLFLYKKITISSLYQSNVKLRKFQFVNFTVSGGSKLLLQAVNM